jgi:hypothetical protein
MVLINVKERKQVEEKLLVERGEEVEERERGKGRVMRPTKKTLSLSLTRV